MRHKSNGSSYRSSILIAMAVIGMACTAANAAVTVIGTQYQEDILYSEFDCVYDLADYPNSCPAIVAGANVHVYLKNSGASAVNVSDVTLAGYSLTTVIAEKLQGQNDAYSIYYYWQDPPSDIMAAGEPIWFRADPNPIPAGGTAQAVIRLRTVPTTASVSIGVVHDEGTTTTTVTKDNSVPRIASVTFSPDLDKAYIHWRRSGGAAPTTIKMDDVDITAYCSTVSDANLDFAVTVYTPASALSYMSYHVYRGIYSDGETATVSIRSWTNVFSYGTYGAGATSTWDDARAWIDTCEDRGVNLLIYNNGSQGLTSFITKQVGRDYAAEHGYGFMIDWPNKWAIPNPRFWYGRDEPDAHDWHIGCCTGMCPPCGSSKFHNTGLLATVEARTMDGRRTNFPGVPSAINVDQTRGGYNYYVYGQLTDIGMIDPYYQGCQANAYWGNTAKIPLFATAEKFIYGTTKVHVAACEPNPTMVALCSAVSIVGENQWPLAAPGTKRTETHYALAGGAKSMAYWWFLDGGLGSYSDDALALWKEIGLIGNEFKAAQPVIVISHPVDMTLQGSTHVWAKALASGSDTLMLVVVNDNHYNDINGCHYTALSNATLTATLPSWMTSSPTAFEVSPEGVLDVTSSLNGSALSITLGTVNLTRLIIVTTNANLKSTITTRYSEKCWEGVCTFASDHCQLPGFTLQPSPATVGMGGTASFSVSALGLSISYQWQKNGTNISNGGHYSGCTTPTLTITGASANDQADYRCVLSNSYYSSVPSDAASLTVTCDSAPDLINGNFDASTSAWTVASNWTSYNSATATFAKDTATYHSSPNAQRITPQTTDTGAYAGVHQSITANVGDAVTFVGWAYANSNTTYETARLGARFDGSTTPPTSWQTVSTAQTWTSLTAAGTVTVADGARVFLDVIRGATGTYWSSFDDVAAYYAFLTPAPTLIEGDTSTSIDVDVDPGCNLNNSNAQYAITIGGGSYTLGTHWVQANGTVSTSTVWQTDSTWGTKTVTGLTANTTYTFKVKARYSSTYTQATDLSSGIEGTPHTSVIISQQPAAQSICIGENASFGVVATGEGTVTYQWQKDEANISNGGHYSGCTTATLAITGADTNDAANYRCKVTDSGGSVFSEEASLMLMADTAITSDPSSNGICTGEDTELYVVATGDGTLTYQWQKNQSNLSDGGHYADTTSDTLLITGADTNDSANYRCVVTGDCGSPVTSNEAALTVTNCNIPTLTNGTFEYSTAGSPPFGWTTYVQSSKSGRWLIQTVTPPQGTQWMQVLAYNTGAYAGIRQNVTGLTSGAVYTISGTYYSNSATSTAAIRYNLNGNTDRANSTVLVSKSTTDWGTFSSDVTASGTSLMLFLDTINAASSNKAAAFDNIAVCNMPSITQQPSAQSPCSGGNASFAVTVTGGGALTYQWQKNSANQSNGGHYSGCTTATLTVTGADTNDATNYRCVVAGDCGSVTSNQAALSIGSATSITGQPSAQGVCTGTNASFSVTATGVSLTYQWQKNSVNQSNAGHYSGCTTATLTVTGADTNDVANYRCVVTGTCGSATSNQAALSINSATSITGQPSAQNICPAANASFSVTATGTALTYQWQKNSANQSNGGHYSGCTTATLTVTGADTNDVTNYRCVVSGTCGTATSNQAALSLKTATGITTHPSNQSISAGASANFSVVATGDGTLTYQWQKNSSNQSNGGHYSGCTTATLTISTADTNDSANYRCVVTGGCGSATSNQASLTVTSCSTPTLTNGTFEYSTAGSPPYGWTTYVQSSKSGRWLIQTVTPPQGTQWMQVLAYNTGAYAGIRQNVTGLTSGAIYTISGTYYSNSGTATASVRYNLSGDTTRTNSTVLVSKSTTDWGTFSSDVTASGTSLMLFLDCINAASSNKAAAFDNIKVICKP